MTADRLAALRDVLREANNVIENNYGPDPTLVYDVKRWQKFQRAVNRANDLAAAGVTVAPKPDSPAADDGVACDWDENGYCRCKPAPALDVERLARAIHQWHNPGSTKRCRDDSRCRHEAAAIAREYAALATGDEP